MTGPLRVGSVVYNERPFRSPTGASFLAGERFVVDLVGPENARATHDRTGSVVWICGTDYGCSFLVNTESSAHGVESA